MNRLNCFSAITIITILFGLLGSSFQTRSGSPRAPPHRHITLRDISPGSGGANCPIPLTSCAVVPYLKLTTNPPVSSDSDTRPNKTTWECLDVYRDPTACGSCDNDCMRIPNAEKVGCEAGLCKIYNCQPGFVPHLTDDPKTGKKIASCIFYYFSF